ncbi:MAG TPA: hypothetical protein VNK43_01530 [Gemmatimonadales bacterium]|nr:hypothetical protein [Gemmatimonadales bacterium]
MQVEEDLQRRIDRVGLGVLPHGSLVHRARDAGEVLPEVLGEPLSG